VTFDPTIISLESVLEVFFTIHDPTTLNRQGNDIGTQYRSGIFYLNDVQKEVADSVLKMANEKIWDGKIVTEITPFSNYYAAEAYHQNYYNQNTQQGYCNAVVTPKVAKFRKLWASSLKK
jgi:peptide-methionine (S)-S-oxide reductase